MLFNSAEFLFGFLPLSLAGYYLLGRLGGLMSRVWLCVASLGFYAWWDPAFLLILLFSILFNFSISLLIGRAQGKARSGLLAIGVVGNLSALAYYKYAVWFVSILVGAGVPLHPLANIMLPLGISFFTFTQIGYLIDVKEEVAKERGFVNYVLFVTFFPHLIAGPILHHREIMPQFADQSIDRFNLRHFAVGLSLFAVGLFKKTVIADGVAPMVAAGYAQGHEISTAAAWLAILSYVAQLYFDFSGYSDMAVGIARMFNVKFPLNFNSPLKAQNMGDFWQRWHMTLTRYLNAYLYNPIAVSLSRKVMAEAPGVKNPFATPRGFLLTVAIPTFWTMSLAGVWHGAGAQFVLFGLIHSAYITIYRAWVAFGPKRRSFKKGQPVDFREKRRIVCAVLLTTLCWAVSLVFFRSPNVSSAFVMLRAMVGQGSDTPNPSDGAWLETAVIALLFAIMWFAPNAYEMFGAESPALARLKTTPPQLLRWRPTIGWAVAVGLVGAVGILAIGRTTEFLYFQF